jgi:glycogen operon protein
VHLWPGDPYPLGVTFDGTGANIAVYAPHAESVELCLFADDGEESRVTLPEHHGAVWHGYLPVAAAGQRYGFRVHGPWDPARGVTCNPAKLLLDPYARAIEGDVHGDPALRIADPKDRAKRDPIDSAPHTPRSVIVSPYVDWGDDRPLRVPLADSVIYEAHVKGATICHPGVDPELRGTYAGLAHPAFLDHLSHLGVTALELLPVHQFVHDQFLLDRGLRNYWGYNSIGFFAPHNEYASRGQRGEQVHEFQRMVRALHERRIEVILDVVYNHTGEAGFDGPTLCFRGFDGTYYRGDSADRSRYVDSTGTGNALNFSHSYVLQLVMDSLRYWVTEMHVDGFRFDLAVALSREQHGRERVSAFFDLVQQDPVLSRVKLIAEPWDIGVGGYQVGNFPAEWAEWNGKFRDDVRDVWRGAARLPVLATRLAGSSDLYSDDGRKPFASVNFVTAHDGFTLRDLVSYNEKHNEANGDANRDGESHNRSWNCGVEGPTDDPSVVALRERQMRNFLVMLFVSQGAPMLLGGDELGRTQGGNNNGYCQDNGVSWFDWPARDDRLVHFTRGLITLRRESPVLRRRRFLTGQPANGSPVPDIEWLTRSGDAVDGVEWDDESLALGVFLNGDAITEMDRGGRRIRSDSFVLCINAGGGPATFTLPDEVYGREWTVVVDTRDWTVGPQGEPIPAGGTVETVHKSVVVLRRSRDSATDDVAEP